MENYAPPTGRTPKRGPATKAQRRAREERAAVQRAIEETDTRRPRSRRKVAVDRRRRLRSR